VVVCGQTFSEQTIGYIQATIEREPEMSRVVLSRRVSGKLNWRSPNGKLKEVSCRVALSKLDRRGVICLQPLTHRPPGRKKTELGDLSATPEPIQCRLEELDGVELVRVNSAESKASKCWNELMGRYHYLGSGPLCGAQLRYLIKSGKGQWLGGLAFSASAWRVKARDHWIGWSDRARKENLHKVVSNSRFLICPWVKVQNLASHVLGQAMGRLRADWQERYGFEPVLLETFVDRSRFLGTSYRATNWLCVGQTAGRGRQDRQKTFSLSRKDVYVYSLRQKAREILCSAGSHEEPESRTPETHGDWAHAEFGEAELNDERLNRRLLTLARDFYERPQANLPQACQSRAKTRAAHRFFDHPKITMDKLLKSHYEATLKRISEEKIVLVVQDTTSLNYSAHPLTEGLGPISPKSEGVVGLLLHDSMAFNLAGAPLGLVDVQCWARDPKQFGKRQFRHELSIEHKESQKWLKSFHQVGEAQKRFPKTTLISVADREADIYELFHLAKKNPCGAQLLVRAEHNRLLADGHGRLWEHMAKQPVAGTAVLSVPRQGKRAPREAHLEVRFGRVKLTPPSRKLEFKELDITVILAQEIDCPQGIEPLQWMLLTTMAVENFDEAVEKLSWYAKRWGIEVYHRTLKSGCKIEERQLGSADRLEACLAIDMVVAWRIFHLAKLGRETSDVPCSVFFEEAEWKALYCFVRQDPKPPDQPPTLREAVRMVASLGGFLGRPSDGEPGTKSLWLGIQRLDDIAATWKFMALNFAPHLLAPPVFSKPGYG
jgi:Druantia protein DruA/Transposase DNA-binding/Transposase Tn5 dimerisation domain